jgi:hypothetical protein
LLCIQLHTVRILIPTTFLMFLFDVPCTYMSILLRLHLIISLFQPIPVAGCTD